MSSIPAGGNTASNDVNIEPALSNFDFKKTGTHTGTMTIGEKHIALLCKAPILS